MGDFGPGLPGERYPIMPPRPDEFRLYRQVPRDENSESDLPTITDDELDRVLSHPYSETIRQLAITAGSAEEFEALLQNLHEGEIVGELDKGEK